MLQHLCTDLTFCEIWPREAIPLIWLHDTTGCGLTQDLAGILMRASVLYRCL
jgi:hypothetical protein